MKRDTQVRVGLLLAVSLLLLSPLFWTTFGCGGSTVEQIASTTASGPTISLTGTATIPTTSTQALISALGVRVMKSATTDSAGSGLTCVAYTLEGENLGEAKTDSTGAFTLTAGVNALKPTDATTTSWTARFYVQCTDADGKYDVRNYCEASVDEASTTSIGCSADPDTTLTTRDLLSKTGCLIGASCAMSGVDPLCFMGLQQRAYKDSGTASGTGVQDDLGAVREVSRLCMAAATPAALGFNSADAMLGAVQGGTLTSAQLEACGASSTQKEKFAAGATTAAHFKDIFYSSIAGGAGISAALALEMKGISQAETGSACDLAKSDSTYAQKLVATYGAARDASELETMKGSSNLGKTILASMAQYCPDNKCDFAKFNPAVLTGTLSGCGMDPNVCGFTDANGKLQSVFDKLKLTIDTADKSGVGADFDKLRALGASWGNTFKTQGGPATAAGSEAVVNRTAQLFGSSIGALGIAYDPTAAGATTVTYQTKLTGSGGTTLDTCLTAATTDATKLACYAAGNTSLRANGQTCLVGTECSSGICNSGVCSATASSFLKANGTACAAGTECSSGICNSGVCSATAPLLSNGATCTADTGCLSGYCGGTTNARKCTAVGLGLTGEVCSANNQCTLNLCLSSRCTSMPGSFSLTSNALTTNNCVVGAVPVGPIALTVSGESGTAFTATPFTGTKSANTFALIQSGESTASGCTYNSVTTLGGAISPFACTSAYATTLTVVSGNCLATIGSNVVGATCTQTFASPSCTTP
ncbi:MAG: hypothetical protein HYY44_06000 [Deltaproteobacteria bacterium]|nr:hypothetical protein [Deltaproteobacteria bacterium]